MWLWVVGLLLCCGLLFVVVRWVKSSGWSCCSWGRARCRSAFPVGLRSSCCRDGGGALAGASGGGGLGVVLGLLAGLGCAVVLVRAFVLGGSDGGAGFTCGKSVGGVCLYLRRRLVGCGGACLVVACCALAVVVLLWLCGCRL